MILGGQEITRLSTPPLDLVAPFIGPNTRCSSYDLTVGNEYYCGINDKDNSITLQTVSLPSSGTFSIPAHGICFVLCSESLKLPTHITARVALRMSHIYQGLVLTAQPPFDPGYQGKVIVMLHNLSSAPVHVKQGDRIATIEFHEVAHPLTSTSPHRSVTSLAGQLTVPLQGSLVKINNKVNEANYKVNGLFVQLGTIIALLIAVPAIYTFYSHSTLLEKIGDLKTSAAKSEELIQSQQKQINYLQELLKASEPVNPTAAEAFNPAKSTHVRDAL